MFVKIRISYNYICINGLNFWFSYAYRCSQKKKMLANGKCGWPTFAAVVVNKVIVRATVVLWALQETPAFYADAIGLLANGRLTRDQIKRIIDDDLVYGVSLVLTNLNEAQAAIEKAERELEEEEATTAAAAVTFNIYLLLTFVSQDLSCSPQNGSRISYTRNLVVFGLSFLIFRTFGKIRDFFFFFEVF